MRSIVLLSGGLDSSLNLAIAKEKTSVSLALTIAYKQKAEKPELLAAKHMADFYQVPHKIVQIDLFKELNQSGLISKEIPVPQFDQYNSLNKKSAAKVWVPNRNGLFINIAACFAETYKADLIITGFNLEEAETFPDNSKEFISAMNKCLLYSTSNQVKVHSYTQEMSKHQIVAEGRKRKLPFELIWSCYLGNETPCGNCESCLRYKRALETP